MAAEKMGNVVLETVIGNTRIRFCDDYCRDKTRDDVEKILAALSRIAEEHLFSAANRG